MSLTVQEATDVTKSPEVDPERAFSLTNGLAGYRPLVVTCAVADLPNVVRRAFDPSGLLGVEVEVTADGSAVTVMNPDGTPGFVLTVTAGGAGRGWPHDALPPSPPPPWPGGPCVHPGVDALQAELAQIRAENTDLRKANRDLYQQVTHDELTSVWNRRGLAEAWDRDVDIWDGLALIDLDRFKEINDTFGHAAGDAVLRHVAQDLADRYRIVARLGGDELVVVDARQTIRDLADDGLTWQVPTGATVLAVTATVGCVRVYRSQRMTLAYADRAMYRAKAAGRGSTAWASWDDDAPVVERPRVRLRDTRVSAA